MGRKRVDLEQNGYPQELIKEYDVDQKKELYDDGGVYATSSTKEDYLSDEEAEGEGTFSI